MTRPSPPAQSQQDRKRSEGVDLRVGVEQRRFLSHVPLGLVQEVGHENPPHPAHHRSPVLQHQRTQRGLVASGELGAVRRERHLRP